MSNGASFGDREELRWNFLTFRSRSEVRIAEAFDSQDIAFLPNCKGRFRRANGGVNYEPDFLIPFGGRWAVLEVDGPHHNNDADCERDAVLRANGIDLVFRASAEACYNRPGEVVSRFIGVLNGSISEPVQEMRDDDYDDDDDDLASLPWDQRARITALDCAIRSLSLRSSTGGVELEQLFSRAQEFATWLQGS